MHVSSALCSPARPGENTKQAGMSPADVVQITLQKYFTNVDKVSGIVREETALSGISGGSGGQQVFAVKEIPAFTKLERSFL